MTDFNINMHPLSGKTVPKRIIKKTPIKEAFGRAVKSLRLQQKLSQEKLSEYASLSTNYVGAVERGERNVTLENICKLSEALNIHPADLFKKIQHPFRCSE